MMVAGVHRVVVAQVSSLVVPCHTRWVGETAGAYVDTALI